MKRVIFISLLATLFSFASAQDYQYAIGYRAGQSRGITFKSLLNEMNAYELSLSFRHRGVQFTPMLQFYTPSNIGEDNRFFWYYGFGMHTGYQRYEELEYIPLDSTGTPVYAQAVRKKETQFVLGADVIFGLEYRVLVLPFTMALEYKPYIGFFGIQERVTNWTDFNFTIRYIIK